MKKLRWQLLIIVLALVAVGWLLLNRPPASVLPTPEVSATSQPVTGGVYVEGLVGTLGRLNPVLDTANPPDRDIDNLIYSSLVRFDDRGAPVPDLASSWGISQDGTLYNFSLREDARWHDGEPVTTKDVVFTIDLLKNPELPLPEDIRKLWDEVEVTPLNDYLMQFRLPEPFAPFLDYLSFGILPEHLLGTRSPGELVDDAFNLHPIGSGLYRFEQFIVEDGAIVGVELVANEDYFREQAFIERLIFKYYPTSQEAFQAYQAGEVDGISQITRDVLPEALAEADLSLYTGRLPQMTLVLLNLNNPEVPFFQDFAVRKALLMGLNRQKMIDDQLGGQAIIANGPIFPGTWAYYEGVEKTAFDPEGAISMLVSAGYTIPAEGGGVRTQDDRPLSFTLVFPEGEKYAQLAERIRENWAGLGVQAILKPVPNETLMQDYLEPREYEAALVDLNLARTPDPDPYPFWHQTQITGGQNYSQWDDRAASEFLEQARITFDLGERTRLYRNFQVQFARELPALPLFFPVYTYGVRAKVQGVSMGPLTEPSARLQSLAKWYLASGPQDANLTVEPTLTK